MKVVESREWYGMRLELRVRWWLTPYLIALGFFCGIFGCEPDWGKLKFWLRLGMVATVDGRRVELFQE